MVSAILDSARGSKHSARASDGGAGAESNWVNSGGGCGAISSSTRSTAASGKISRTNSSSASWVWGSCQLVGHEVGIRDPGASLAASSSLVTVAS